MRTDLSSHSPQHDLWSLAAQLLPNLPNPFADEIKRSPDKALPFAEANSLTVRILGSKTKQDKDLPIYDHLVAVKETVTMLASQDATLSKALQAPVARTRWALHQRTTVPWPMQPRRGEKSAPVVATDRVHLDWFTSIAATEHGKLGDVEDEIIKAEGVQDQEDEGALTRLQAEGYLGEYDESDLNHGRRLTWYWYDRVGKHHHRRAPRSGGRGNLACGRSQAGPAAVYQCQC